MYYTGFTVLFKEFEEDLRVISFEFICKCGQWKSWIADGKKLISSCPFCGRWYRGQYNFKTLSIEAIEIDENGVDIKKVTWSHLLRKTLQRRLSRLGLWFLAYYRLNNQAVCEMSKNAPLWGGYHDYSDGSQVTEPYHFFTYACRRCGKRFLI